MKKIILTEKEQHITEIVKALGLYTILPIHIGKVLGFPNAFVLSNKDLIRYKNPPFDNVVIPSATQADLDYMYNNGLKFMFKPSAKK